MLGSTGPEHAVGFNPEGVRVDDRSMAIAAMALVDVNPFVRVV